MVEQGFKNSALARFGVECAANIQASREKMQGFFAQHRLAHALAFFIFDFDLPVALDRDGQDRPGDDLLTGNAAGDVALHAVAAMAALADHRFDAGQRKEQDQHQNADQQGFLYEFVFHDEAPLKSRNHHASPM